MLATIFAMMLVITPTMMVSTSALILGVRLLMLTHLAARAPQAGGETAAQLQSYVYTYK